jgi:ribonuclease BN (tRNA processing enzyme)
MLKLHVLGVGDAFTERYHNSCLCIEEPQSGVHLLVDCPPALPRVLADHRQRTHTDLSVANIEHLLLTHLHGDHCGGLEAFLFMRRFIVRRKPNLYGAKEVLDPLWATRLRGGMANLTACVPQWSLSELEQRLQHPSFLHPESDRAAQQKLVKPSQNVPELQLSDYAQRIDLDERTQIGPLLIERRFTYHHVPTTAIRVSLVGQDKPLLAYSADTAFDPDLIAWLSTAELVVHETNFGIHTPLHSLMQLPERIRHKMRLIHYPDILDHETSPIPCLREGTVLTLA